MVPTKNPISSFSEMGWGWEWAVREEIGEKTVKITTSQPLSVHQRNVRYDLRKNGQKQNAMITVMSFGITVILDHEEEFEVYT